MDEDEAIVDEGERIDPVRTALLGACSLALAAAFLILLLSDQVGATF